MKTKAKRPKHWYMQFVGECCVCGRDASYRERMTTPRPRDRARRYKHLPDTFTYCGCLDRQ